MSDIRIKMAKDLRDMSDMVGDLHWMAAKAVEDLTKKDGEIAKRDEELAACRIAVENCELFRARVVELESDRDSHQRYVMLTNLLARIHRDGGQYVKQHGMDKAFADADAIVAELYAAPVSEAKAHGNYAPDSVVWIDAHHVIEGNNPSFIKDVALVSAERTSETQIPLARLNAAPAAPAADAWIQVSERLPAVESRLDQECRVGTLSIAPLNVSAAVLVFDGEKVRSTRLEWFDGCLPLPYCITHWMPLPAAPAAHSANGVV